MVLARISVSSCLGLIRASCSVLVVLRSCSVLICAAASWHLSCPAPSSSHAVCGLQAAKRDMEDMSKGQAGSNRHHFCPVRSLEVVNGTATPQEESWATALTLCPREGEPSRPHQARTLAGALVCL